MQDIMSDKLFIFSVLMFTVFAVPIIANKTRIPSIVFYILFGVILERFVSPGESFKIFSDVGKLYLMFIAGVEIDIFIFKKNVTKSAIFGVLSFIIPQVAGTIVIVGLFGLTLNAAILIASLFASHTLLSLAIINKFGIGNTEPISVAVGASIVSDIAVLALLAVIADLARGMDNPLHYWVILFGSWVLFICAILFIVPKIARRVFHLFSEDGYAQFLFAFSMVCFVSWLAHTLQLKPLIGAFFCGLALCKSIPKHGILMTKINFVGNTFFIPFFFISAGMLINPNNLSEFADALILGAILTVLAIVTKTAAGFIYGKAFKYTNDAIMMISGMTIQQAATTIVIAVVGLEVGILNETHFNAAMILILLSCSIGEIISVHFAGRYARNLPKKSGGSSPFESKTLVFIPNIASCANLLDFACLFRHSARKYVVSPLAIAAETAGRDSAADAETLLGVCMNHANELEEVYQPEMRFANNAVDGILRTAVETRAGMVVCPFENHCPTLIDECLPRLVFTRMTKNISATNRILAVFMPTSEDRSDLLLFITEMKHLAQQVSAKIVFYLSDSQAGKISGKIEKYLTSASEYEIIRKNHWNTIKRDLPGDIRSRDAIIISMGTRQKLFRLPSAEKYPLHLAGRFNQNCIFAAYPPLSVAGADDDYSLLGHSSQHNTPEYPNLEAVETADCDFRSITAFIAQKIEAAEDEIYNTLLSSLELYPVELTPGSVLVHAHTEAVAVPRIFLWHQSGKNEIAPAKITPSVLIVVLNPLHGDPQIHLKTLSRIAGIFMNPSVCAIVENSANSADLIEKLQGLDNIIRGGA
jgi:Kef-type K+ transport system membrane component KefB/mannitol/fructose-specific phosphotransferase system IIA component (Ntr-type)